jgi:hypothetical protein
MSTRRWTMIIWGAAGIIVLLGAAWITIPFLLWTDNWASIVNVSGEDLKDLRLDLKDVQGNVVLAERIDRLPPGESVSFRHRAHDTRAQLRFVASGREFQHSEVSIDLWTGEGWVFEVRSGGQVASGYEGSPMQQ